METTTDFDYTLHLRESWPPEQRPAPPYGPGAIEIMRSCTLRSIFESSPGYERRMGFAARIGTAFHRALQSFNEDPLPAHDKERAAEEARRRFQRELRIQEAEAKTCPRERALPRQEERIWRAAEAVVVEALRTLQQSSSSRSRTGKQKDPHRRPASNATFSPVVEQQMPAVEVEVPVESNDNLFRGRVDRVEHREEGTWLFDYKSALRHDLPGRYERQLQLYALMWHDTRGEWPVKAQVLYPLVGTTHSVQVEPELCLQAASESKQIISRLQDASQIGDLAAPGDICKVCDFRPWCQPFWDWQASESSLTAALDKASIGFEGQIRQFALRDYHWHLGIAWRNAEVQLRAPQERLPHLVKAEAGMQVRVLETMLRGLRHQPRGIINEYSELFLIM